MYYYSVDREAVEEIVIKKSRFISYISPIDNEEDAENIINVAKEKWPQARHYCYAYILRNQKIERYSDDGEPSGTAGVPILSVLRNNNLENVIIVVTRYFGGTLLGAPGLVRAYSQAASQAIQATSIKKYELCTHIQVVCDYTYWGNIEHKTVQEHVLIANIEYLDKVKAELYCPVDKAEELINIITSISNGTAKIETYNNIYINLT